jgi:hypothetical protein
MKNGPFTVEYILQKTHGTYEQEGLQQEDFQTVLRASGEAETTQENIQDRLQPDEGDPGFQLLTEIEIFVVTFFIVVATIYIIKFSIN